MTQLTLPQSTSPSKVQSQVKEEKMRGKAELYLYVIVIISTAGGGLGSIQPTTLLTKISTRTSRIPGSGMDQGLKFFGYDSGGSFSMTVCVGGRCCYTGKLNTEDDNWELGQVDWFVGRQIGECNRHHLQEEEDVRLILQHEGSNAGRLDWVRLHSWDNWREWRCPVGVRLDHSERHSVTCTEVWSTTPSPPSPAQLCNGRPEFCQLSFDQFLFPGAHNAGTGQAEGSFACAYKNQDLNIEEQLELGIRFFDIDIIFSHSGGCEGLETGHGKHPEFGLYQCYGKMSSLFISMRSWLDSHPSEVVVLNFGNIEYPNHTISALTDTMMDIFPLGSVGVKMNRKLKQTGAWPTLGEAVQSNERIFVFVRDTVGAITASEPHHSFVKEIKVKPETLTSPEVSKGPGEVTIFTSYRADDVEGDCAYIVDSNDEACSLDSTATTIDFLKLSFFSKFSESGTFGTECLWESARKCNVWPQVVVRKCTRRRFRPNFILLDYPNYQGNAKINIVQLCNEVNLERSKQILQ